MRLCILLGLSYHRCPGVLLSVLSKGMMQGTGKGQGTTDTSYYLRNCNCILDSTRMWWNPGTGCPERLWNLLYLKVFKTRDFAYSVWTSVSWISVVFWGGPTVRRLGSRSNILKLKNTSQWASSFASTASIPHDTVSPGETRDKFP